MTRTERQKLAISRWIKTGGTGTVVACTGFRKNLHNSNIA